MGNEVQAGLSRRHFIGASAATLAASLAPVRLLGNEHPPFQLNYAPHYGHFEHSAGPDFVDQVHYAADQGFRAWEDNGMKSREPAAQERIARAMTDRGVRMGVFVGADIDWQKPTIASRDEAMREKFLADIRSSIEVAKRVNATWMTIVPGHVDMRLQPHYQMANVVESLKRASELLEPHGLVMVLEPLNFWNHPGMFLTTISQAFMVCKAVDSPSCKILFDIYHQQIQEGNIIPNIEDAWDEIAYFQVGDNPGRKEPTTGEINYLNIFGHIHRKGYSGIIGMEHGKSGEGLEGEAALVEAYRASDRF